MGAFERQPLSRIALTPPLILQLDTWDRDNRLIIPSDSLSSMVCTITLQAVDGEDRSRVRVPDSNIITSTLIGSTISTPYEMESQTGHPGVYLVFPDIGVAYPGTFRLKCVLMPLNGGEYLDFCVTNHFTVYLREQFTAPVTEAQATTEMTRHFAEQGVVPNLEMGTLLEFWPEG
ncbi:hypothetical protein CspHIS471_0201430 [Cutaneotrichosporon sp. HIS471]|nr:hypothetical protein CspHIS471_0201430 [Cutaneotrichosporon sp. HIS471]